MDQMYIQKAASFMTCLLQIAETSNNTHKLAKRDSLLNGSNQRITLSAEMQLQKAVVCCFLPPKPNGICIPQSAIAI